MIDFRKETKVARLHDPRASFALAEVESEVRFDPLTGNSARICHFSLKAPPPVDLDAIVAASRAGCPFCPDKVGAVTPRYPEDIVPGGRLQRGSATVFPNLFPYDDLSAIAVLGSEHFVPMHAIPVALVADGLAAARDFIRRVRPAFRGREAYGIVTWNYMPPAGATQVHPHMQVIVTTNPGNGLRRELAAEDAWFARSGRAFAADLVAAERGGPRWIGATGAVRWFVPFAPTGLLGDCAAIFQDRHSIAELMDKDIEAFAEGLVKILAAFAADGLWSFNLALLPEAFDHASGRHWLTARLLPRLYLNPRLHVPDVAHMQLLMEERFAMTHPETVAARLRTAFA